MGWFNLASLLLGLTAWVLPIVNLAKHNKAEHKNWIVFSVSSIGACAISLFFQIVYQNYLAGKEDWSAIMDTSGALVFVSAVLLFITIMLNVIVPVKYRKISDRK